jgi:hypothetical protein
VQYLALPNVLREQRALCSASRLARAGVSLLLLACLAGCSNQYSMELTVPMYKDYAVRIPSAFTPGSPIPARYSKMDVPVCNIPDEAAMWDIVKQKLGGLLGGYVAGHYSIDRLDLLESRMTATIGTFDSLTFVKLGFKPLPVNGVDQTALDLGNTYSEQGLGTEIVLVPPVPVDLVPIMQDAAANTTDQCPLVAVEVHGTVPASDVAADVSVRVRATVTAKGVLASFAVLVFQLFL